MDAERRSAETDGGRERDAKMRRRRAVLRSHAGRKNGNRRATVTGGPPSAHPRRIISIIVNLVEGWPKSKLTCPNRNSS